MAFQFNDGEAAVMKYDKRFRMYAQDFYCPLVSGDYERGSEQFFQCKSALISEVLESNGLAPSITESAHDDDDAVADDSTSYQDVHDDVQEEIKDDASNAGLPKTGHLAEAEQVNGVKTEELTVVVNAPPKPNRSYFHPEHVKISPPSPVETRDTCTNTSQPLFADIAVGNSQPEMMEASTGMSQKDVSTIDCGIQTSQELYFQAVPQSALPTEEASTSASKKAPIVFPRVRCQTSGPGIPAKVPRLSDLDQGRVNLNPIYSSEVTFEFNGEESDKENDRSILRQRGNVRNLMKKESNNLFHSPSKMQDPDGENDENVSSQAHSSWSDSGAPSRGPFLRVGLSKRLRIPKPLHPRTFDWE